MRHPALLQPGYDRIEEISNDPRNGERHQDGLQVAQDRGAQNDQAHHNGPDQRDREPRNRSPESPSLETRRDRLDVTGLCRGHGCVGEEEYGKSPSTGQD